MKIVVKERIVVRWGIRCRKEGRHTTKMKGKGSVWRLRELKLEYSETKGA